MPAGGATRSRVEQTTQSKGDSHMKRRFLLVTTTLCLVALGLALALAGCGGSTDTTAGNGDTSATTGSGDTGTTASSDELLIIGACLGLSGEDAVADVPVEAGLKYWVDKVNKEGGIAGHQLKLIVKDNKSDPQLTGTVTDELIDEGAVVIIGPPFPGRFAPAVTAAAKRNVSVISGCSTQPEAVYIGGAKAYLAAFGDNVQAAACAEYALKQGYKTVYTLTSPDLSYTQMQPKWFVEVFEKGGGTRIGDDTYSIGQQDFSPQVTKIASLNPQPDVIYCTAFMPDVATLVRQLRAAGVTAPYIGGDGLDTIALPEFAGKDADGVVFSTHGFPVPGSTFEAFQKGLTDFFGTEPEAPGLSSLSADAIEAIRAAVEKAGSLDPKAIGDALGEIENVPIVNGTLTYKGTDGVPNKPVTMVGIKDGKFEFVESFIPSFIPKTQ